MIIVGFAFLAVAVLSLTIGGAIAGTRATNRYPAVDRFGRRLLLTGLVCLGAAVLLFLI